MRYVLPVCVALVACNQPPVGPMITLEPPSPTTLDDLSVRVTEPASDPNRRDTASIAVTWWVDGFEVDDLAGSETVTADRTTRDQTWTARVDTTDGDLDAAPVEASVTIRNLPPEALTLALGPAAPRTDDPLVATATATDPDGDPVTLRWAWTVNGSPSPITLDTVPPKETLRDDTWEVTAIATDGTDDSAPATASVFVENTPPTVLFARVDPSLAYETSVLACKGAGWADPDLDPESYDVEWRVNNAVVATTPTLDGSAFKKGDRVACSVTPLDPFARGATVGSSALNVRNSLPIVTLAEVTPAEPTAAADIETRVRAVTDADGDGTVLRYTWLVDGVEASTAAYLRRDLFRRGQSLTLWIRAFDGQEIGNAWIWNATVENAPPAAPRVTVDLTSGALVCRVTAASVDADRDTVTYSATWTRDGAAYTGPTESRTWTDDTVPAATSGRWECALTPEDPFDAGTPGLATRTL